MQDPFSLYTPISGEKTYVWCNVSCNVWLCMNETSKYLDSFFIQTCFIPLFRIYCFSFPLCFYGLAFLICYASITFWNDIFVLMPSYRITNFTMLEVCDSLIPSSLENKWTFFFVLDFSLDFHVVNKFNINNENLLKQYTYVIHVNKNKMHDASKKSKYLRG